MREIAIFVQIYAILIRVQYTMFMVIMYKQHVIKMLPPISIYHHMYISYAIHDPKGNRLVYFHCNSYLRDVFLVVVALGIPVQR